MTEVNISEFRKNIKKYTELVKKDEILVTNNGKAVLKIVNPNVNKVEIAKSLIGVIKDDKRSDEEILSKRLSKL